MFNGKQRSPAREDEDYEEVGRQAHCQSTDFWNGAPVHQESAVQKWSELDITMPTKLAEIQKCWRTLRWEPCLYAPWQRCDKWHCSQTPYSNWNHAHFRAKKSTPESLSYRTKAPANADAHIRMMAALLIQEGPWKRKIHTAGNGWACYYTPTLWNYTFIRRTKATRQLEKKLGTFQKIATSQNFLCVYIHA